MTSKILLVEDEPDIRKTLKYNFSRESFDVITAGSISEAKSLSSSNQVDLIILDLMLPDGSGLDFCRTIKSDEKKKSIDPSRVVAIVEPKKMVKESNEARMQSLIHI